MIIKTEVRYVARLSNGIIIEDSDFRNVYRCALRELRDQYGHSLYFDRGEADIVLCVVTDVFRGSRCDTGRIELRKICNMNVYSMCLTTHVIVKKVVD